MKKKLAVFIAVHTYPEVAKLTIGSFLRAHQEYEIELHLGCHSNYSDYCKDLSLFRLGKLAQIHLVDEIDWIGSYNACWYRYSVMHAKNLENLFKQAKYSDFDQAVILDHDLLIKKDFITPLNERFPGADLIGCLFEDRATLKPYQTAHSEDVHAAPKISVWHSLLSRRFYDEILKNPESRGSAALYRHLRRDLPSRGLRGRLRNGNRPHGGVQGVGRSLLQQFLQLRFLDARRFLPITHQGNR
jgi:hypothetical protein